MNLLNPRYWFQKRRGAFAAAGTEQLNRMRYNALFALDPNVLVRHLVAFNSGDIAGLEHVLEEFENREDKMKIGAFKMSAAVASKPWEVRIAKGEEDNERAKLHQEVLTRFWNRVEATDAFCRNRRGGLRLLVKQMMSAQSRVYAVHDVTWTVRGDGELEALFTFVPAWMFENRTGELRFIRDPGAYTGETMKDGEWLVTVGEGVGISAAILAMAKRLSWNDWLLFSEKCGMPVILGNTGAKEDTPAWKNLLNAIANVAPKTGVLADLETKLQAVQVGGSSGQTTYRELIDVVDRGISALYRGGDLATISQAGDSVGSDSQDGESELMDGDGCALVSETLHRQIDRHVIRFTCGDFEPLAGIVINPPEEIDDVDRDIKVDQHLGEFGIKLSKKDMLARYGRVEATDENDAAIRQQAQQPGFGGLGGLANEEVQRLSGSAVKPATTTAEPLNRSTAELLKAFAADMSPAGKDVQELLNALDKGEAASSPLVKEKASALLSRLPSLLPDDPATAAVIAEAMAKEFGTVELANETDAQGNEHDELGRFTEKGTGSSSHGKKDDNTYGQKLKEKKHREWLKQWDEVDELNDLFDKYANADGDERERAGDVMRKKFAELNAKGIVERNPKEGRAFRVKDAPSREHIMKDDEWERTGRQKYNDPTQRLSFVDLANEDDVIALANERGECESDDPAHCRVHGVPETRPLSVQLAELGYKDRNDVNRQADGVSAERVAQIVSGYLKEHCKVHEAVAALRTNPTVKNAFGKDVTFGEDMILHYLSGYGRSNNQADAKRLKELPLAMHAVQTCGNPRLQYPKGVAPDPLSPPRGTQYVYHEKVGDGDMQCRAWVDSGKVKGWFVK